ncbi:hypothetical protein HGRIS_003902 [Hohenbuehelia grisea]|uniref:Aminoglycoside phosphotransferase domain-containing protein n=1 Tax=Hohenbuehelia grisea TaxID=104357 RepID=A0ABR3JH21_9AGAR
MQSSPLINTSDPLIESRVSETLPELNTLLDKIRRVDLAKYAEALRPGMHPVCQIPDDASSLLRGGMNVHIPVTFNDGTKWLARVRQQNTAYPVAGQAKHMIMHSEIETMRVLKAAGIKVPNAFAPTNVEPGFQGIDFFFVEFVDGSACNAPVAEGALTQEQQSVLIHSIAAFYVGLSELTFLGVGSLVRDPSTTKCNVGPLISLDFCSDESPFFFGPFQSSAHKYLAHIEHILSEISRGRAFTENAAEVYVTHLWLKDLLHDSKHFWEEGPTYIKHADDKGDQIMIDADGHITGVVDWEWAYTASKSEAFAAPLALVDVKAFFDGSNELSVNEERLVNAYEALGRPDLATCVRNGKVHQRLLMVIGQEPDVLQLHALEHALTKEKGVEETTGEWVAGMLNKYKDDVNLRKLRRLP